VPQPGHGVRGCVGVQIPAPCFGDCQGASTYKDIMLEQFSIPKGMNEEARRMMLDPLGYDRIKDIDETYNRNRRKTDYQLKEIDAKNKEFQR
jgi:hypothetical protein